MPLSLLRAAWKHKLLGVSTAVAITAMGMGVIYRLPKVYRAEALILVDPQKIPEKFVVSTVNTEAWDRLNAIGQEIKSSTRLKKIIDDFDLYSTERRTMSSEEIIERMRKDIQIEFEKGAGGSRPGAFRIAYVGTDPSVIARVVNRITNMYIEENLRSRAVQSEGTSDFIEHQLRDAKQALDQQEQALANYKLRHNGELPQQESALSGKLTRLQLELQGNQDAVNRAQQNKVVQESALSAAESALASLGKVPAGTPAPLQPSSESDPTAGQESQPRQQKRSEVLQSQIATLRLRYSQLHPEVRRLQGELAAQLRVEQEEEARQQTVAMVTAPKGTSKQIRPDPPRDLLAIERARGEARVMDLKAQLANTTHELQTHEAERGRILREIAENQQRMEQMPVRDLEMASLTRDYEFSRTYYNNLLSKESEAQMATDLEKRQKAETFRVIDPARPPQKPFKPKRQLLAAACLGMSLVFGLAAALSRELKAGVLLGEWEIPAGITVLSRVPHIDPSFKTSASPEEGSSGKRERANMLSSPVLRSSAILFAAGALIKPLVSSFARF